MLTYVLTREATMAQDETQVELASMRTQLSKQIEAADRIGELSSPHRVVRNVC